MPNLWSLVVLVFDALFVLLFVAAIKLYDFYSFLITEWDFIELRDWERHGRHGDPSSYTLSKWEKIVAGWHKWREEDL